MSLDHPIRQLVSDGLQINIWPTRDGRYQANVKERAGRGWTCVTDPDPIVALSTALRQRSARVPDREVVGEVEQQIDLEEAIAAAPAVSDDDFDGLLA